MPAVPQAVAVFVSVTYIFDSILIKLWLASVQCNIGFGILEAAGRAAFRLASYIACDAIGDRSRRCYRLLTIDFMKHTTTVYPGVIAMKPVLCI